jgi:hypothetical protein
MPLGNLTVEMFRLTLRTFATAFPKWGVWFMSNEATHYCLLLGWKGDFKIDLPALEARLAIPAVNRDLAELNLNSAEKILSCYIADHRTLQEWLGEGPLNTEDNPILEFDVPRRLYEHHQIIDNLDAMFERRNDVTHYVAGPPGAVEAMRARLEPWEAAEPHVIKGHRLYREGQDAAACAEYMKARALCPQDKSVEALLGFRDVKWLADDGRRPDMALLLAELYAQQGRTADALRYADRLLRAELDGFDSWPAQAKKDWNLWRGNAAALAARLRGDAGDAPE